MTVLKKGAAFHVGRFAKYLNYLRASDKEFKRVLGLLESKGFLVVQQGGYLGDNLHHDVLVIIMKPCELDKFKRVVLTGTNYELGGYIVHVTGSKRKCRVCHCSILAGMRYGVKVQLGRRLSSGVKPRVVKEEIICLPCLLEQTAFEELDL